MAAPAPPLRLFRTTAFKLSATYLTVFSAFAAFLIFYIAESTNALLSNQVNQSVTEEIRRLSNQHEATGIVGLTRAIDRLSRRPGAHLYLVTDFYGNRIGGNVASVPYAILGDTSGRLLPVPYVRLDAEEGRRNLALVRVVTLASGFRVLVGQDVSEYIRFTDVIRRALYLTVGVMIVLGLATWFFVSRRVLKRIDSVAETSRRIIAGDLSGRLEVRGNGDEFDRLAESLNDMLERIERLLFGLKEVSDNIAHDLKTPLTRMRTRVERALAETEPSPAVRETLQAVIDDADQLIRVFNALLSIARVEAGSTEAEFVAVDMGKLARDCVELYEPVAEEAGMALSLDAAEGVVVSGNRELLSQTIVNLIDNAIKYAAGAAEPKIVVAVGGDAATAKITVADNGPGIAEADRARVTERFVRLEDSRTQPGAGLGLSLVAAVARLHKGTLGFEDNCPGLRAVIALPRLAEDEAQRR